MRPEVREPAAVVRSTLAGGGIDVSSVRQVPPSLEDVYIARLEEARS
jgi:hypothetical protein